MSKNYVITFSAEEVNKRAVFTNDSARLIKAREVKIEGKYPYTALLLEKISAVLKNDYKRKIPLGFELDSNKVTMRCYVKCPHQSAKGNASVVYTIADLKENQPLNFTLTLKCDECTGEKLTEETKTATSSHTSTSNAYLSGSVCSSSAKDLKASVESISRGFVDILKRVFTELSPSPNPMQAFGESQERYFEEIRNVWINALPKVKDTLELESLILSEVEMNQDETKDGKEPDSPENVKESVFEKMMGSQKTLQKEKNKKNPGESLNKKNEAKKTKKGNVKSKNQTSDEDETPLKKRLRRS